MEKNLVESVWSRGWRDTDTAIHSTTFWIVDAFVGFVASRFWGGWFFIVFIVGVLFALWIWETASAPIKQRNEHRKELLRIKQEPDVEITPQVADTHTGYLVVTNNGSTARFTATCTVINAHNHNLWQPHLEVPTAPFKLKWNASPERHISIQTGDSARLVVGELQQCEPGQRGMINLRQLLDGKAICWANCCWNNDSDTPRPEFDVEVKIFAEEFRYWVKRQYHVSISREDPRGILEIKPLN